MKKKKIVKISLVVILVAGLIVVFYLAYFIYKLSAWNSKVGENLPDTFRIELPVTRNQANYFCIKAVINDTDSADFIIDSHATSLAKIETIKDLKAHYWATHPIRNRNYYGQKEKISFYYFDSFKIQTLLFNKPLFKGITKTNAMYDLMDSDVIGWYILKQLNWKFDLDNDKMILFSSKDSLLLCEETKDFVKIENGANDKNNNLFFPDVSTNGNFWFDLGYQGNIMVDKNIFTGLSTKYSPKIFVSIRNTSTENDTTYVFDGINVEWGNIKISNCQIVYKPVSNVNLIGVELANRFNFVLTYNEKTNGRISNNLYLQPRNNFQQFESVLYSNKFGFILEKSDSGILINNIEVGGLADKAGICLKDKIVNIDHGNFNLTDVKGLDLYLLDKQFVSLSVEKNGKIVDVILNSTLECSEN